MRLTRYRPAYPEPGNWSLLSDIAPRFRQAFDEVMSALPPSEALGWSPNVDIVDAENELLLTAELPGLGKEDVALEVEDGVLTLKGEKKEHKEERTGTYRMVERSYGAFERCFTLPRSVDPTGIKAEFKDGVLTAHLPKTNEAKGRKVEIAVR